MAVSISATKVYRPGTVPDPPTAVTSITKDSGATVSFRAPAAGGGGITQYVVTPYISGAPQDSTTVDVGDLGSITGSDGNAYLQADVTGLTNSTAYTFTVRARNNAGDSSESTASGENTPLSGLVFGDDFNGSTIDPEWWVYTRCGYLAQSEVQYYLPSQVTLSGGRLVLTAEHTSFTGPKYPSAGGGTVTQPWRSGAVQSNTRTYAPSAGNTMTFEVGFQTCADGGNGFWPSPWLEGQAGIQDWKTDPDQGGWNDTDHAEIDIFEQPPGQVTGVNNYLVNTWNSSTPDVGHVDGTGLATSIHNYQCRWKPDVSCTFWRDGSQVHASPSSHVPSSGAEFFLMVYLQMLAGGPTTTESIQVDYFRVYDQNLG